MRFARLFLVGWSVKFFFLGCPSLAYGQGISQEEIRSRAAQIAAREADKKAFDSSCKGLKGTEKKACEQIKNELKSAEKAEKKMAEFRQKERENLIRARIVGCDPDTIVLNPSIKWPGFEGFYLELRLFNENPFPINVETATKGYGTLVQNICPGGSLSVSVKMEFGDSDYLSIPLKAIARLSDGTIVTSENYYRLDRFNSWERTQYRNWNIRMYAPANYR